MVWVLCVSTGGGGATATMGEVFLDLDCGQSGESCCIAGGSFGQFLLTVFVQYLFYNDIPLKSIVN